MMCSLATTLLQSDDLMSRHKHLTFGLKVCILNNNNVEFSCYYLQHIRREKININRTIALTYTFLNVVLNYKFEDALFCHCVDINKVILCN
jgi:hypothetical protein